MMPARQLQLNRLHTSFPSFREEVFETLDKLEWLILETRTRAKPPTRCTATVAPQAPTAFMAETTWEDSSAVVALSTTTTARVPMSDLNGRSYDVTTTKVSSVDDKLQAILTNPRITSHVKVGLELSKVLFTDAELAVSTLTGRRVNGQSSKTLDPAKLCRIDNLVHQKCGLGEAEFSAVRSGIRDSLANRYKYLRLKLGPKNWLLFEQTVYHCKLNRCTLVIVLLLSLL